MSRPVLSETQHHYGSALMDIADRLRLVADEASDELRRRASRIHEIEAAQEGEPTVLSDALAIVAALARGDVRLNAREIGALRAVLDHARRHVSTRLLGEAAE